MDYKKTLNITLSDKHPGAMPQRGNLPTREPEIQKVWDDIDLYRLSVQKPAPSGTFILHDGPPYSNGDIHLGHALNKIAKDIIVKYKTMQGYQAPYVPGWDNHGMPIENEVSKKYRAKGEKPDKVTMRKSCREYAAGFVNKQREQFKRLGVRADWENPYLTMSPDVEASIVEVFGEMAEKGYIYRGLKPVMWCADCETALADAEVEYQNHTSNSIYVRFPAHEDPKGIFGGGEDPKNAYFVIWTTTPWTIPANLAMAVHPDAEYAIVDVAGGRYLLAEPLAARTVAAFAPDQPFTVVKTLRGSDLEGMSGWHPLTRRPSPIVFANYVTMEDGTGIVHTAPGHGKEDFETGQRYGLDVLCPVDASGRLTKQAGEELDGIRILGGKADEKVMELLKAAGNLLAHQRFEHSYPHCWRCHNPLIYRATVQWFMSIDHEAHRKRCLEEIQRTTWYPAVSINRISSMVANRPDWCLSRQRAWGVGIPAFYCKDCGGEILSREAIHHVRDIVAIETSDAWYARTAAELLPEGFTCPHCGSAKIEKETDILDVWFDSGSTNRAVLENTQHWPLLSAPADVYLEGSDQHRGWFNSSLMVSVAIRGTAPYNNVITNGWTLDDKGQAMHKSLGNAVSPNEACGKFGADILRLWVASTDYFEDVRCSDTVLGQVAESYRRMRNTFRFLVNNLHDFDVEKDGVPADEMIDLDRWALAQLDKTVAACVAGYEAFEFHRVYHAVHNFCSVEMSAFYLDVIKDRLYCSAADSRERRSAQTALHALACGLAKLLAPVLSHTADEVWGFLRMPEKPLSAQLADFPQPNPEAHRDVLVRWEPVLAAREQVSLAVEAARQEKRIGNPLEASVNLVVDAATLAKLQPFAEDLPAVFKVSHVSLQAGDAPTVTVQPAGGQKCARCWLIKTDVGVSPELPDLCGRCATVVSAMPAPATA